MVINKTLNLIYINDQELTPASKNISIQLNPPANKEDEVLQVLTDFIDGYADRVLLVNGLNNTTLEEENKINAPYYNLKYTGETCFKNTTENAIGSFSETFGREIVNGVFRALASVGMDFYGVHTQVEVTDNIPLFEIKETPFSFLASLGDEDIRAHNAFLSWEHNENYSPTCSSCQSGVAHMMGSVNYLNNRLLLSKSKKVRNAKKDYRVGKGVITVKDDNMLRFVVLPSIESYQDIVDWISQIFLGAVEMAHIKVIKLRIGDTVYVAAGTDE